MGGWKQRVEAAHKCLLFSSGPLTSRLPAKRGPVRPAPRSNSLISRKNNNVRACFGLNKNKKRPKSCSLRLSLSPMRSVITPLFFFVQLSTNITRFLHCSMKSMTTGWWRAKKYSELFTPSAADTEFFYLHFVECEIGRWNLYVGESFIDSFASNVIWVSFFMLMVMEMMISQLHCDDNLSSWCQGDYVRSLWCPPHWLWTSSSDVLLTDGLCLSDTWHSNMNLSISLLDFFSLFLLTSPYCHRSVDLWPFFIPPHCFSILVSH